jgi:hypothetical protein
MAQCITPRDRIKGDRGDPPGLTGWFSCPNSSAVEHLFCKVKVSGSIPGLGIFGSKNNGFSNIELRTDQRPKEKRKKVGIVLDIHWLVERTKAPKCVATSRSHSDKVVDEVFFLLCIKCGRPLNAMETTAHLQLHSLFDSMYIVYLHLWPQQAQKSSTPWMHVPTADPTNVERKILEIPE